MAKSQQQPKLYSASIGMGIPDECLAYTARIRLVVVVVVVVVRSIWNC